MAIIKSLSSLRDAMKLSKKQVVKKEKVTSTVTLSNSSKLPDSHYFKSKKKCDVTRVWWVENEEKATIKTMVCPTFLFPNQIRREFDSNGKNLLAFQWQNKEKNIQSRRYTMVLNNTCADCDEEVIVGWMKDSDVWMEYRGLVDEIGVEGRWECKMCERYVATNELVTDGVDGCTLLVVEV